MVKLLCCFVSSPDNNDGTRSWLPAHKSIPSRFLWPSLSWFSQSKLAHNDSSVSGSPSTSKTRSILGKNNAQRSIDAPTVVHAQPSKNHQFVALSRHFAKTIHRVLVTRCAEVISMQQNSNPQTHCRTMHLRSAETCAAATVTSSSAISSFPPFVDQCPRWLCLLLFSWIHLVLTHYTRLHCLPLSTEVASECVPRIHPNISCS